MRRTIPFMCAFFALIGTWLSGQSSSGDWSFPAQVEAGVAFSVPTTGSGSATLYIVGPANTIRREIHLGENISFGADDLHNAGHYCAFLVANSPTQSAEFDVVASQKPATLSFLAKPSRLPVNLPNAISGVAFIFDTFRNLIVRPEQVSFELVEQNGRAQSRIATSRNGVAWLKMNSAAKAGAADFRANLGSIHEKRVIQQVAGDPCSLKISARKSTQTGKVTLETEPVRDCNGNPVSDGTIVSFTEAYEGGQSTVDVPLKRGIARTELPARNGAVISAASGVVMGNEIRWSGGL